MNANVAKNSLQHWAFVVHERFHVNAVVFIALNVLCAPLFYYSIYRTVRAARAPSRRARCRFSSSTRLPFPVTTRSSRLERRTS